MDRAYCTAEEHSVTSNVRGDARRLQGARRTGRRWRTLKAKRAPGVGSRDGQLQDAHDATTAWTR